LAIEQSIAQVDVSSPKGFTNRCTTHQARPRSRIESYQNESGKMTARSPLCLFPFK
jgi:hypothetical protein